MIWKAKTDNTGKAELWHNLFDKDNSEPAFIEVKTAETSFRLADPRPFALGINHIELDETCSTSSNVDILFITDATGSMGDEIEFLKVELKNIIERTQVQDSSASIRLGSMFYRCEGNSYTTIMSSLDSDFNKTIKFIGKQNAGEGGDEAVEIALTKAVHDFDWSPNAKARIVFLILDEAPGTSPEKIKTYQKALADATELGIRIVPLVASGVGHYSDKSLEYLMRSTALASNGTYAFFTNHSGVGNDHSDPETDAYDVEHMNDMILRMIRAFSTVHSCENALNQAYKAEPKETKVDIIERVILDSNARKPVSLTELTDTHSSDSTSIDLGSDSVEYVEETAEIAYVYNTVKQSFSFYPNPTAGLVHIKVEGDIKSLFLADMNGKLLQKYDFNGLTEMDIDLSLFPRAVYFIQYESMGKWHTGKIVLTR